MKAIRTWLVILLIVILGLGYASFYTVKQNQKALILQFGKMVMQNGQPLVMQPGLHFKIPVADRVIKIDTRLQTLEVQSKRVLTAGQKYVLVSYYVKWKINNVVQYYMHTGGVADKTETLLQQQVNDALLTAFSKSNIGAIVADGGNLMQSLQQKTATKQDFGIEIIDIGISSIKQPDEVRSAVFDRMRTEQQQVAAKLRTDGTAQADAIRAQADATTTVSLAQARKEAADMRAAGDAEAASIYAAAYSRNPSFYAFYRSLEAYKKVFSKNAILILRPDSQFFKYFHGSAGEKK